MHLHCMFTFTVSSLTFQDDTSCQRHVCGWGLSEADQSTCEVLIGGPVSRSWMGSKAGSPQKAWKYGCSVLRQAMPPDFSDSVSSHVERCPTWSIQPAMLPKSAARTCALWTCTDGYAQNAAYARNVPRLESSFLMADRTARTASRLQRSTRATTCAVTRPVCTWVATRDTRTGGPRCMPRRQMRAVSLAHNWSRSSKRTNSKSLLLNMNQLPCIMQRR